MGPRGSGVMGRAAERLSASRPLPFLGAALSQAARARHPIATIPIRVGLVDLDCAMLFPEGFVRARADHKDSSCWLVGKDKRSM